MIQLAIQFPILRRAPLSLIVQDLVPVEKKSDYFQGIYLLLPGILQGPLHPS